MSKLALYKWTRSLFVGLMVGTFMLIVLWSIPDRVKSDCDEPRIIVQCVEESRDPDTSGPESVQTIIPPNARTSVPALCHGRINPIKSENRHLSKVEQIHYESCKKNYKDEIGEGWREFKARNHEDMPRQHHKYLTSESVIIEVGGNKGDSASAMIDLYRPYVYIILEPVKLVFRKLKERFNKTKNVVLYNFGLGALNGIFYVNIEGQDGELTSLYKRSSLKGTCSLKIVNATSFFLLLGVGCFEVDLLVLNCEGCELDVLESVLSSNLINYFRHIQFVISHSTLEYVSDPVERYCKIQQFLLRTHRPIYQFRYVTETWRRKDIVK